MASGSAAARAADAREWGTLIERAARGEEAALAGLYDGTVAVVHGLVLRILRDPALAEEVTGDVYLQVWHQAVRYDPTRGAPLSWLLTVARSRAIDRLRSARAEAERAAPLRDALDVASEDAGPEESSSLQERRRLVRAALATLAPEQRAALELAYFGGLSHSEIARRLGEPLGTVKTRIRLAMTKVRQLLAPAVGEVP